jgi:hypothetical protein
VRGDDAQERTPRLQRLAQHGDPVEIGARSGHHAHDPARDREGGWLDLPEGRRLHPRLLRLDLLRHRQTQAGGHLRARVASMRARTVSARSLMPCS